MKRIVILGGGAAGLVAAIAAAEAAGNTAEVLLLEQNPRVGKKLLATGNGRCNLDNTGIAPEAYATADRPQLARMLAAIQRAEPLGWFAAHGLLTRADEAGRVYPYSNQAADLVNLLLHWLERTGVTVETGQRVAALLQRGSRFLVRREGGEPLAADAVICALGGSAGPQFGTDGFGPQLAAACGLRTLPQYPCLAPLRCRAEELAGLAGLRVKATARLWAGERLLGQESGEVQFTEQGVSGICVMQLSNLLTPAVLRGQPRLTLDLFPQWDAEALTRFLAQRFALLPQATGQTWATGLLPQRIGAAVWRAAGLPGQGGPPDDQGLGALAHTLKAWPFTGLAPLGWRHAQATGGGLALAELEAESFALRGCPGLYFVGETLDCAGACGGFNLHWAFGSGLLAGRSAAAHIAGNGAPHAPRQKKKRA